MAEDGPAAGRGAGPGPRDAPAAGRAPGPGPGAVPWETAEFARRARFVLGRWGSGLPDGARAGCAVSRSIAQFGSTRSINAGVAAGIAMHGWVRQHGVG